MTYNRDFKYRVKQTRKYRRPRILRKLKTETIVLVALSIVTVATYFRTQPIIKTITIETPVTKSALDFPFDHIPQALAAERIEATLTPIPTTGDSWENFKLQAIAIAKIYDFSPKLIIAQAALESAHGTSEFAVNRYNYFGIGAYDSTPNDAFAYENQAQCIIDYIYVIKNNFPEAWQQRQDPAATLNLIEHNDAGLMWATDPNYVSKVMSMPEWEQE